MNPQLTSGLIAAVVAAALSVFVIQYNDNSSEVRDLGKEVAGLKAVVEILTKTVANLNDTVRLRMSDRYTSTDARRDLAEIKTRLRLLENKVSRIEAGGGRKE